MLKLICNILGEDYNIVKKQSPESKRKIQLLGSVIWLPVSLWMITVYMFGSHFFHASTLVSLSAGVFAGMMIFIIERAIILSKSNSTIKWFRISLGVIMAILGSVLLDEILFAGDIRQQKIRDLNAEYEQASDLELSLVEQITQLEASYQQKLGEAQKEAQGNGSGYRGVGDITRMIQEQSEALRSQKLVKEEALAVLRAGNKADYDHRKMAIESGETDNQMLYNIQALFKFVFSSWTNFFLFFLVFIMLGCIECLVILLKVYSPPTSYERYLDHIEEINENRLNKLRDRYRQHYDPMVETEDYQTAIQLISKNQNSLF